MDEGISGYISCKGERVQSKKKMGKSNSGNSCTERFSLKDGVGMLAQKTFLALCVHVM